MKKVSRIKKLELEINDLRLELAILKLHFESIVDFIKDKFNVKFDSSWEGEFSKVKSFDKRP